MRYTNAQIAEVVKYIKYIIENVETLNNALDDALRVTEIEQQNKRYREALERIARINIEQGTVTISEVQAVLLARKALEGEE